MWCNDSSALTQQHVCCIKCQMSKKKKIKKEKKKQGSYRGPGRMQETWSVRAAERLAFLPSDPASEVIMLSTLSTGGGAFWWKLILPRCTKTSVQSRSLLHAVSARRPHGSLQFRTLSPSNIAWTRAPSLLFARPWTTHWVLRCGFSPADTPTPDTVGTSEKRGCGSGLETFAIMSTRSVNLDTYSLSLLTAKEDILNPRSSTNW